MKLEDWLNLVADPTGYIIAHTKPNVQAGEKAKPDRTLHFSTADTTVESQLRALNDEGCDIYFTPAHFTHRSRLKTEARSAKAVWVDVDARDDKGFSTLREAAAGIAAFVKAASLPQPTIVVTGGGFHCYWVCDTVLQPSVWDVCAKSLHTKVKTLGGLLSSDTARIKDISSLMRLPGYRNHKRGADARVIYTAPVIPMATFVSLFAPTSATAAPPSLGQRPAYLQVVPTVVPTVVPPSLGQRPAYLQQRQSPPMPTPPGNPGLTAPPLPTQRTVANPINTGIIAKPTYAQLLMRCAQLRDMVELPNEVSEPAWKLALNLVMMTEDGMPAAHEFSSGYAKYDREETELKASQAADFGKPVMCSTMGDIHKSFLCDGCSHKRANATPIKGAHTIVVLGDTSTPAIERVKVTNEAEFIAKHPPITVPRSGGVPAWGVVPLNPSNQMPDANIVLTPPPAKYTYGHLAIGASGVFLSANQSEPVTPDLLWVDRMTELLNDTKVRTVGYRVNHIGVDGEKRSVFIGGTDLDKRAMQRWVAERGIAADVTTELTDYIVASCQHTLRSKTPPLYIVTSFGWYEAGGKRLFVSPTTVQDINGELEVMIDNGGVIDAPKRPENHSVVGWCEGYKVQYLPDDYYAHFFILASLASVLYKMTESDGQSNGMIIAISGTSATGKTHLNHMASSVWGKWQPVSGDSTWAAIPKEAGRARHIPVFVDDLTVGSSKDARLAASNAVLHYTGGTEKSRLTSGSKLDVKAEWRNLMFMSTNIDITSLLESADSTESGAAVQRTIEIRMPTTPRVDVHSDEMRDARKATFEHHYGTLGNEFIRRLMEFDDQTLAVQVDKRRNTVAELLAEAGASKHIIQAGRMRVGLLAMCYVVAGIMHDVLPFDAKATIQWCIDSMANGEFVAGLASRGTSPSYERRIRLMLHRLISGSQNAAFHWVLPHPEELKGRHFTDTELVHEIKASSFEMFQQLSVDQVGIQMSPRRLAREHNAQLANRHPSVDVIQQVDHTGAPNAYFIRYDWIGDAKHGRSGLSARAIVEALGEAPDGGGRDVLVPLNQITPGTLTGIKGRYIRITPTEMDDITAVVHGIK